MRLPLPILYLFETVEKERTMCRWRHIVRWEAGDLEGEICLVFLDELFLMETGLLVIQSSSEC